MTRVQPAAIRACLLASAWCLWDASGAAAQSIGPDRSVVVRPEGGTSRRVPARKLLREGTFLADRQGWLRPVGAERWAIVFDAAVDPVTGQTTVDPPMAILPCLKTMEMRRIVEARAETVTFRVSGRVMVYKGRNYLLPTFFVTVAETVPVQGTPGERPVQGEISEEVRRDTGRAFDDLMGQSDARKNGNGAGPNDPDALLRNMDLATPNQSIPTAPAGGSPDRGDSSWTAPHPNGGAMNDDGVRKLAREGTMLTSRLGRLLRGPAGELVFAPDNGTGMSAGPGGSPGKAGETASGGGESASGGTMQPGPMRLIPCLNLQEMERLIQAHPVPLKFKVSGQVFVYEGKNYLLPTMYLIEVDRDGNVTPGQ